MQAAALEQLPTSRPATYQDGDGLRWLMTSDVCKHCTDAACLDVCPTGALFRTEFGTVVVQEDVCNGCGYCVPACPFGVIDRREDDGRVWKCTLCYDRLKDDLEPACAQACPTDSIQFGELDELRERAERARCRRCTTAGSRRGAALRRRRATTASAAFGAFFLLLDEPEVYGLPPDPVDDHARPRPDLGGGRRGGGGARRGDRGGGARGRRAMSRAQGATVARRRGHRSLLRPAGDQAAGVDAGDPAATSSPAASPARRRRSRCAAELRGQRASSRAAPG